jgi:hypothetical protein
MGAHGSVGTTQRWSTRRSATTASHSEASISSPCSSTTTGPSPPLSWYWTVPAGSSTCSMVILRTRPSWLALAEGRALPIAFPARAPWLA